MALRKGDFVVMLWSRYALMPPSAILSAATPDLKHRLLSYQLQARIDTQPSLYITTMCDYYQQEKQVALNEDYYEEAFVRKWELMTKKPTPVSITNVVGVEHVGTRARNSFFINRNSQLPILTLEKIEEWWDYQDFRQFLYNEPLYAKRFYNWYRRCLEEGVRYVHYDPIWSISPLDPNYELFLYYYAITIKRLKGWRSPVPLYLIYRPARPYLYLLFGIIVLSLRHSELLKAKKKEMVSRLSEDFWMSEVNNLQNLMKPELLIPTSFSFTLFEAFHGVASALLWPFFQFMLGPNSSEILDKPFKEAKEIAAGVKPHPAARDKERKNSTERTHI